LSAVPFAWSEGHPQEVGMSAERLEQMLRALRRAAKLDALLVIRHDRIVFEYYGEGFGRKARHYAASLTKALVGGVSLILALGDGRMDIAERACKYVPQWRDDPLKSKISLLHLSTHSSGIEDSVPREPGTWKDKFWEYPRHYDIARDVAPVLFEPGTRFRYSNPGMAMLSYCISAALSGAPEPDVKALLCKRVMRPLGIGEGEWSIAEYGGGKPVEVDGLRVYANWGGSSYSPDAVSRIGRLMLRKGNWDGTPLLDRHWVGRAIADSGAPIPDRADGPNPRTGLCWWVNADGVWEGVPRDAFVGAGAGNQALLVVPGSDLIAVRFGEQIDPKSFWGGLVAYVFNPLFEAIK
jgi:CubicO group peptidase (beta-lactamase class C family)